jgi:hypothetical protein
MWSSYDAFLFTSIRMFNMIIANNFMQYLSPAYKVKFVLVTTINVSPKEPDDALFGRDVKT